MEYRATGRALLLAIAVCGTAPAMAATPADGATLAGACTGCHGPEGRSAGAIPSLAGMPAPRFTERMRAYRDGPGDEQDDDQGEATIMNRIAPAYDERQIAALAEYFAGRENAVDEHRHAP